MKDFSRFSKIKIVGDKFDIPLYALNLDFKKYFLFGINVTDEFFKGRLTWDCVEIILNKIHERNL